MKKSQFEKIKRQVENRTTYTEFDVGVKIYAIEMLQSIPTNEIAQINSLRELRTKILGCTIDFIEFSYCGFALMRPYEIKDRLGFNEETLPFPLSWFDVQAKALSNAFDNISDAYFSVIFNNEI